ncbi:MAG: SDR family NAD(P)-dependent oxidoreductase [Spirochaetota bacterium]
MSAPTGAGGGASASGPGADATAANALHCSARLAGRVVIVTGGNKGIGRGIVARLAREGARVVFTGRDEAAGRETVELAAEEWQRSVKDGPAGADGGDAVTSGIDLPAFLKADNADPADIARVVATTVERYGRIDGLVNNAATLRRETILTTDFDFLRHVLEVNLMGAIEYTKRVMEHMIELGGGSIVHIGSTHAWSGLADLFPYSIAKGGLLTLSHHIARNYASHGIRSNWVTVGWVITPGEVEVWRRNGKDEAWIEEKAKEVVPLGRLQTPEEIGAAVAFLLSDDAAQITDTELDVAGGLRV